MRNQYKLLAEKYTLVQENDKEDVMSGLKKFDEDDKIVQTVLNNLKEQTKDPSYTSATVWINMFMDTYCPEPEKPGRRERGLTEHDKISHTVHNALNYYINNYGAASDDNKKIFDELAYVLLYDVIVDRDVSDHFRQIYRQYQNTLELPRIALYPQEYGYRESVEGDKEDILAGLQTLEDESKYVFRSLFLSSGTFFGREYYSSKTIFPMSRLDEFVEMPSDVKRLPTFGLAQQGQLYYKLALYKGKPSIYLYVADLEFCYTLRNTEETYERETMLDDYWNLYKITDRVNRLPEAATVREYKVTPGDEEYED